MDISIRSESGNGGVRMKKEELKKLRTLNATAAMMRRANADVPKRVQSWGNGYHLEYKYGIYVRVQILKGILKAAFFLTEQMRSGGTKPIYEVFINKETGEFITWDANQQKWRNAKLDMLEWPEYHYHSGKYSNAETNKSIKRYLGVEQGGFAGILKYQLSVREDELKQKHKRETNPWDMDMDMVSGLPKDWDHWVDKTGIGENYIFYEYERSGAKQGYCTYCEKKVPVSEPKHNKFGVCKCCGKKIQFKSRGKAGCFYTKDYTVYLLQKIEIGFVLREFKARRRYQKGYYESAECGSWEIRRVLYDEHLWPSTYYYGDYKNTGCRWIKTNNLSDSYWSYYHTESLGKVYMRTIPNLAKNELNRTGLPEMLKREPSIDPETYLLFLRKKPYVERIAKASLTKLAWDICFQRSQLNGEFKMDNCGELAKAMGIDKSRMKRIRANNGGVLFLEWMKHEKRIDTVIDDDVIKFFDTYKIEPKELDFIVNRMKYKGISNYLRKQLKRSNRNPKELLGTWEDYLCMANRLKMNTQLEIFYKPKDLVTSHDEAVKLSGGEEICKRAGKISEKWNDIDDICKMIQPKYGYQDDKYAIVVPEKIEDIILEGRVLGHCLDSSDRYFERIHNRESYIVFLRKAEDIETPYYTLEIEPNGTARQKRTTGDKQNADFDDAKRFIKKWQKEIQKNLSKEDKRLAEESEKLRIEEFIELRKTKAKIWHGHLAGKLLAEVLEADLMEVENKERKAS